MTFRTAHRPGALALVLLLALILAGQARASPPPQTQTIGFDDRTDGTAITDQYGPQGVYFGPGLGFSGDNSDTTPVIRTLAVPGQAHSPSNILDTSGCTNGYCHPDVVARFAYARHTVSLYAGDYAAAETTTVTLTAYDAGGSELDTRTATVTGGAPFDQPLSVSDPAGRIAFITVTGGNGFSTQAHVGIDDLSFDAPSPPPPPDFGLNWSQTIDDHPAIVPYVGVREGYGTPTTINIIRFPRTNTGTITFTAAGLPQGVTASFNPAGASGASTEMTLSASTTAPSANALVTVTATPSAGAGSSPRTLTVPVEVRPNFAVTGDPSFAVPAARVGVQCGTPTTTAVRALFAPGAYGGPDPGFVPIRTSPGVALSFAPPPGVTVSGPGTATGSGPSTPVTLTVSAVAGALTHDTTLPLTASSGGYPSSPGSLTLHPLPATVSAVTPAAGATPQYLQPGTDVTVTGTGLCAISGVQFGNAGAVVPPASVSGDGRTLHVNVPALATTGPVTLVSPLGNLSGLTQFTIDSLRNTAGFAFTVPGLGRSLGPVDYTNAFGLGQTTTAWSVDPCAELGLAHPRCGRLLATEASPLSAAFYRVTRDLILTGAGHCFGMSLLSRRLAVGQSTVASKSVWSLTNTPAVASALTAAQLQQLSGEFVAAWRSQLTAHVLTGRPVEPLLGAVRSALARGVPSLLALRHGSEGHVVLAYGIEGGPTPGAYYLDVYDPSIPFTASENAANGLLHSARYAASRVLLTADERWADAAIEKGDWGGSARSWTSAIAAVPADAIPLTPHVPSASAGLLATVSAATIAQVSDDGGRRLYRRTGGNEPPDPGHLLRTVVPFSAFQGVGNPAAPAPLVLAGSGHLREAVRPTGAGAYGVSVGGAGYTASVSVARGARGETDTLDTTPGAASVGVARGGPRADTTITLTAQAGDGSVRALTLGTASGRGLADTVTISRRTSLVTVVHRGAAVTLSLRLAWSGSGGLPQTVDFGPLSVPRDAAVTLAPSDWHRLGGGPLVANVRAGRMRAIVRLHPRVWGLTRVGLAGTRMTGRPHGPRTVTVRARLGHGVAAAAAFTWIGERGRHVVWTRTVTIPTAALVGTLTRSLTLPHGKVSVVRVLATLLGGTDTPLLTQASTTLRVR